MTPERHAYCAMIAFELLCGAGAKDPAKELEAIIGDSIRAAVEEERAAIVRMVDDVRARVKTNDVSSMLAVDALLCSLSESIERGEHRGGEG